MVTDRRSDLVHVKVWQLTADGDPVLVSLNPRYGPIAASAKDISVEGVAYGLLRLKRLHIR